MGAIWLYIAFKKLKIFIHLADICAHQYDKNSIVFQFTFQYKFYLSHTVL